MSSSSRESFVNGAGLDRGSFQDAKNASVFEQWHSCLLAGKYCLLLAKGETQC